MIADQEPLISIRDLKVHFPLAGTGLLPGSGRLVKAVDGVNLEIQAGETMGLVGESGAGKQRWAARPCVWLRPPRDKCCFAIRTWPGYRRKRCGRIAAGSRSSSRTLMLRSIRA